MMCADLTIHLISSTTVIPPTTAPPIVNSTSSGKLRVTRLPLKLDIFAPNYYHIPLFTKGKNRSNFKIFEDPDYFLWFISLLTSFILAYDLIAEAITI